MNCLRSFFGRLIGRALWILPENSASGTIQRMSQDYRRPWVIRSRRTRLEPAAAVVSQSGSLARQTGNACFTSITGESTRPKTTSSPRHAIEVVSGAAENMVFGRLRGARYKVLNDQLNYPEALR